MIPRIKSVKPLKKYILQLVFDDGKIGFYDMEEDMNTLKGYDDLRHIHGLLEQVKLDESRTCVFWNDYIDLPSDTLYEFASINKSGNDLAP